MRLIGIYRTESDWCALVEDAGRRLTLTYAQRLDEATVLGDAEAAFESASGNDPVFVAVDGLASLDDKKTWSRERLAAVEALLRTEPELADSASALASVAKGLI